MAWTTPATWVSGLVTSAIMNAQVRDNLNALQAMVKPGTAIVGSSPASTTLMTVQAFSAVVTLSAANGSLTYPTAFPNGIQSITITPGDNAASLGQTIPAFGSCTLSTLVFQGWTAAGAAISAAVRVNVIAIGW